MARRDRVKKTDPLKKSDREVMTLADLTDQMTSDRQNIPLPHGASAGLMVAEDGVLVVGGYQLTPVGLVVNENATFTDWETVGVLLLRLEGAIQLLIGDWLVQAERQWGQTYEEIAEQTGYSVKSLYQYKWVAENVPFSMRIENLTFTHYATVAGIEDDAQKATLLHQAAGEGWSVTQLRQATQDRHLPAPDQTEKETLKIQRKRMTRITGFLGKARSGQLSIRDREKAFGEIAAIRHWLDTIEEQLTQ